MSKKPSNEEILESFISLIFRQVGASGIAKRLGEFEDLIMTNIASSTDFSVEKCFEEMGILDTIKKLNEKFDLIDTDIKKILQTQNELLKMLKNKNKELKRKQNKKTEKKSFTKMVEDVVKVHKDGVRSKDIQKIVVDTDFKKRFMLNGEINLKKLTRAISDALYRNKNIYPKNGLHFFRE